MNKLERISYLTPIVTLLFIGLLLKAYLYYLSGIEINVYPHFSAETYIAATIIQVAFILFIFISGFLMVASSNGDFTFEAKVILSFPIGLSLFFCVGILLLITKLPFNEATLLVGTFFVAALIYLILFRKRNSKKNKTNIYPIWKITLTISIVLLVAFFSAIFPIKEASFDSVHFYGYYPSAIAAGGKLLAFYPPYSLSVGQFQPIIASISYFLSFSGTYSIQYMLTISAVFFFFWLLWQQRPVYIAKSHSFLLILICCIITFAQPVVLVIASWQLSNIYGMIYLLLLVGILYYANNHFKNGYDVTIAVAFTAIGLCFSRIEGIFMLLVVLAVALPLGLKRHILIAAILPSLLISAGYYGVLFLYYNVPNDANFLTRGRVLLLFSIMVLFVIYTAFFRDSDFMYIRSFSWNILGLGSSLVVLILFSLDVSHALYDIKILLNNLFDSSIWGAYFILILTLYIAVVLYKKPSTGYFDIFNFTFIMMCLCLWFIREQPLRVGIGDSGNRMIMMLAPTLCLGIFIKFFSKLNGSQEIKWVRK